MTHIESGIAMPESGAGRPVSSMGRTAQSMQIGDSVLISPRDAARLYQALYYLGRKARRRKQSSGAVRVWRSA